MSKIPVTVLPGSMIEYGGSATQIQKQIECPHEPEALHGPCMDKISRFFKCKSCWAILRDMTEEAFLEAIGANTEPLSPIAEVLKRVAEKQDRECMPYPSDREIEDAAIANCGECMATGGGGCEEGCS